MQQPSARPVVVQAEHIDKRYSNGTEALRDISLSVDEGDFVSLVGPSGCGKSTLLRIIAGLGRATAGTLSVMGSEPGRTDHSVAFVFQDANLLPWRSVEDNAALPLELRGVKKAERLRAASEALELVGLAHARKAVPGELSGGMQMRVSIARALVTRPQLLLMDEPFGALDEITRQRLNDEQLALKETTGATIVFVTHNVFEAVYLSSRIVVMSAQPGTIVDDVAVPEGYPRSPAFRGSSLYAQTVLRIVESLGHGALGETSQENRQETKDTTEAAA